MTETQEIINQSVSGTGNAALLYQLQPHISSYGFEQTVVKPMKCLFKRKLGKDGSEAPLALVEGWRLPFLINPQTPQCGLQPHGSDHQLSHFSSKSLRMTRPTGISQCTEQSVDLSNLGIPMHTTALPTLGDNVRSPLHKRPMARTLSHTPVPPWAKLSRKRPSSAQ